MTPRADPGNSRRSHVSARRPPPRAVALVRRGVRAVRARPVGGVGLLLAAYLLGLTLHHEPGGPRVVDWLAVLTQVVPACVCWDALRGAGARRAEVACLAAGVSAFAAGNVFALAASLSGTELAFPSPADAGYLGFYPAVLAAVALAARREHRAVRGATWMDGLLGGLGAAAVLAVVLRPVLAQAAGSPFASAVALAYPASDLLLVAVVVGVAAVNTGRQQRAWLPLLTGLVVFALADVVHALQLAAGTYELGTPLDGLWAVGSALVVVWARAGAAVGPAQRPGHAVTIAVPVLAATAGLAVLVVASRSDITGVALALAVLTLVATVARAQVAFGQLRRLADLRRQATTDELTGLPNRRAFSAHVDAVLAGTGSEHALLLLDLDTFKEVNDSLGHQAGDQLLARVGERLTDALRDQDVLGRLGGDEFAVLLEGATRAQAEVVAVALRAALAAPFLVDGTALRVDVSIGVALAPEHGTELSLLLRRADLAMYKAKRTHAGHGVFSVADDRAASIRLNTLHELRAALEQEQLTLHYQPKLDLVTRQVTGVEALVRWCHPVRGLLYPDSFLALVEEAGLMPAMTRRVLVSALDQAVVWRAQGRCLTVAVNLSASALVDTELPDQVSALLRARGLPGTALQIEITEESVMADRDRAREILQRLRDRGVQISVDDFGTGYSSLAYLRELPVDELKLDRSFVFPMADDARAAALVMSTIGLAHSLGLRMVAEGVESRAALDELTRGGCDQAQGYYLSRPLPAAALEHWLDGQLSPAPLPVLVAPRRPT